ncbi:hypothetical protein KIN20_006244 [Parelaphostrongylus tenuis]|uniref:Uncharacterized protein n=1 Tax=Parelaphostrongylus tenuis TaxID=148309 RepID=A0AAD5M3B6_PARTN|nr:hypothetical protein KIN20_006244 [Parelaphostrongylus tenuis]
MRNWKCNHERLLRCSDPFSDYEQMSNPGLVRASTSPYVDTESDDECDPPPPPKSLAMFQSPTTSHALTTSVTNSPHSMSPLYTTSGTPSVSDRSPSSISSGSRFAIGCSVQTISTTKRSVFNDLYDDGTESSPPPEERTSLPSTTSSTASTSV